MSRDPFEDLAVAIRRHTASIVGRPARYFRARVKSVAPLEASSLDDLIHVSEDDEDVEMTHSIKERLGVWTGGTTPNEVDPSFAAWQGDRKIKVGDLVEVREDDEGYTIVAVIA